jgi:hypothetical protein
MRLSTASFLPSLVLAAGLLNCGIASAQQASFAVAVTLHTTMSKPLSVAQLCPAGKPTETLGAIVRVECPLVANAGTGSSAPLAGSSLANPQRQPEVTVTF